MKNLSRRSFIKKTAAAGAASLLGESLLAGLPGSLGNPAFGKDKADISVVEGNDRFAGAVKAVENLGGMKRFVSKGSKVGILVNCQWKNRGSSVHPDVFLAAAKMCYDAGAQTVCDLRVAPPSYWKKSPLSEKYRDLINSLKPAGDDYVNTEVKGGLKLKMAQINRSFFDYDVFINIPVSKHHAGIHFTGTLKNMMGLSTFLPTLKFFHFPTGISMGWYGDVDHLSQCIADLNLVRKPDLCIVDSTEFLTTNGPSGPGELKTANKIAAGVDRVALDVYCARLVGQDPDEVLMIKKAWEHGLGEINPNKIEVLETTV